MSKCTFGFSIRESVNLINQQIQNKKVLIATEINCGTLPTTLQVYSFHLCRDNVTIAGPEDLSGTNF